MLGPASALFLFPNWLLVAQVARGLMHSLGNRSSRMRKQEPDIYPLHCRKPLMPQGLLPAHRNSQSLQVLRPAARCSSLPTPAQALVLVTGREVHRGKDAAGGPSRQRSVFPSHLGEGLHAAVDVLVAVHSRNLDPDAGFPLGDHGVAEANDVNTWGESTESWISRGTCFRALMDSWKIPSPRGRTKRIFAAGGCKKSRFHAGISREEG